MRFFLALVTVLVLGTPSALAYVRTKTSTGLPIAWKNPCIPISIYLDSPPPLLSADQYFDAAQKAASVWSHDELACSDIRIFVDMKLDKNPISGRDGENMIIFRQDSWCPRSGKAACYAPNALALTTIWKNTKSGEIPEADIEINAVATATGRSFEWNDIVANPTPVRGVDFQNMLTHELGHVLGLAHNCYTASDDPPSLEDHLGNHTVDCYNSAQPLQQITEATMYPTVDRSDYSRRTLVDDDIAGICAIYPFSHDVCPVAESTGGCQVAHRRAPESPLNRYWILWILFALSAVFFLVRHHCHRHLPFVGYVQSKRAKEDKSTQGIH